MYISLRYLFLNVLLAASLGLNARMENQQPDDAPIKRSDIEQVLKEQKETHFAYMPKEVQRVLRQIKEDLKADGERISEVVENYIQKDSNVLPYELALEVIKESSRYADQLNDEQKQELEKYRQALANRDAEITVEMKQDPQTRKHNRNEVFCCLLAQCLRASNANICGVAQVGRLNVQRGLQLPDGTLITGAPSILALLAGDVAATPGGAAGPLATVLAPEALRFIRGVIDPGFVLGGAPTIISGAGFTVAPATPILGLTTGVTVTYTTPYPAGTIPAVVVSGGAPTPLISLDAAPLVITSSTNTGFTVFLTTGVLTGLSSIHFHVAGPRVAGAAA